MATDRARRSFDVSRRYRTVVAQQGRVTLEADVNEAEEIRTRESRAELLDIIGPTGTPDDGFKITVPGGAPFDFDIGAGTLYLGGVRLERTQTASYQNQRQTEWVDRPSIDPDQPSAAGPYSELVYLTVTEQEVGAVEDPALREVALGGPDTAARTRLISRVRRAPMTGSDCERSLLDVLTRTSPGLVFDPTTQRLTSAAQLKVAFAPVPGTADPCQPTAQAGFLGAENQLIRVQVASDRTLLWGYDNASFLYRVSVRGRTLELQGTPVDVFHRPRTRQRVEVLATAVSLSSDARLASAFGAVCEIASYDATANVITLTANLPQSVLDLVAETPPPQLFVRIWESQLAFVGNGTTPTTVSTPEGVSTGLDVYTTGTPTPGDYWMIGVRPNLPNAVFPARLTQMQPPDGPARWATSLATIAWNADRPAPKPTTLHDCRRPFDNLVELTRQACCELKVMPGDNVQKLVDDRIRWNASHSIKSLHLRFGAGVFDLAAPLTFAALKGGEITVSGCGTKLVAASQECALVLVGWDSANVHDIAMDAAVRKTGQTGVFEHLGGALTFLDCGAVDVNRVVASCGSGLQRAASCITIRNRDNKVGNVRVRSCELLVGTRQLGLLLVNVARATVEDNQVRLFARTLLTKGGPITKRRLIGNVRIGSGTANPTVVTPSVATSHELGGGLMLHYVVGDDELATIWTDTFRVLAQHFNISGRTPGSQPTPTERRRIERVITWALNQVLTTKPGPLTAELLRRFRAWLDKDEKRPERRLLTGGQGITVGGVHATDVRILNNTISGVMDGIHLGLSGRGPRDRHHVIERVQVIGNTITQRVPKHETGAHAGIFIGNVNVATVRDNRIESERVLATTNNETSTISRTAHGIRVYGIPGDRQAGVHMLLITGNVSRFARVGIEVVQVGGSPKDEYFAQVTQNLVVNAQQAMATGSGVKLGPDNIPAP